jgi:hypothetical protein
MSKNICISVIVLFITLNIYSQELFEKKGMWGVSYGANVYYPRDKTFTTGSYDDYFKRYEVNYYHPQLTIGHFIEISKYYRLKNINSANKLFVIPILGIKQVKYYSLKESYLSHNNYLSPLFHSETQDIKYLVTNIGLMIKHIVLFENSNSFFTFLSFNYNHQVDNMFKKARNNITLKSINLGFGLGYGIGFNNLFFSPFIKYEIISESKYLRFHSQMYNNMQFGVLFNF